MNNFTTAAQKIPEEHEISGEISGGFPAENDEDFHDLSWWLTICILKNDGVSEFVSWDDVPFPR